MLSSKPKSKSYQPQRAFIPFFVLLVGLFFTFSVSYYLSNLSEVEDQVRFKSSVQAIDVTIEGRIETYIALLRAGTGLFAASESVERGEFKRFIDGLDLQTHYPGIQGIGFSLRLRPEEKNTLVESVRREGLQNFRIWPSGERSEYHSIIFLEPLDRDNQLAIGFDMFTNPVIRAAMERARDTGLPAASGRITLLQEIDQNKEPTGFLICAPVYRNGSPTSSEAERRNTLLGFVYSPLRAENLLREILGRGYDDVQLQIYDGDAAPENLIYDSSLFNDPAPSSYRPRFIGTRTANLAGRTWTLNFATRPKFDSARGSKSFVSYTLAGGVLISLLFFVNTRSQARARAEAERAAIELRSSEATVRESLAQREQAEEALKESEERYRELIENANDIVYTIDLEGKLTSVNKAGELITGYSLDELLNTNITEILSAESVEASQQMLGRKLAGEQRTNYELDIKAKNGNLLTLEISNRLVLKGGKPFGVQGIARDITVRRRAEEALREADQRALSEYERLLERITALAQTLGTARDLLTIFRGLREFTIASVPCDGLFVSLYDPVLEVRNACYGWGDGQEIDTTKLPAMPVTLAGPNSRAIRTGEVIITDDYMSATRGHPAVMVGPDNGRRPQSSVAVPMAVMGRIIGTIEVQSYERAACREEHVTAMLMAANLTAIAIENVGLLERESTARAVAEESNRLKDEFLATVSHELRTPLTAILGWSRMLESGSLEGDAVARAIETIGRNAKAQSQIIDDILDVSRIITGKLYLNLHPIDLEPVIEAAINVVRPTAEAKEIRIETDLEPHPAVISGDANRLQQVIWNLLSNAIKFTPRGGRVRLSLRQGESQVEIKVADTGQGISDDFLPFVFDRFRQADSTTTRQHGGLGLGLAIARHLVEIHGGTIQAESSGAAQGAIFTVRLPLISSLAKISKELKQEEVEEIPKAGSSLKGLHLLLVDDDRDTLEMLSAALTQREARVTAVSSAGEAIEAIKVSQPDVLISDIAMANEDGYVLINKLRTMSVDRAKTIPAVAITAYAKEEDRQRALSSGYQHYLAKPIELSELVSAVADAAKLEL